jgi:hypothetical protein
MHAAVTLPLAAARPVPLFEGDGRDSAFAMSDRRFLERAGAFGGVAP